MDLVVGRESVQEYYGRVFQAWADLKTSVGCAADKFPARIREILSNLCDQNGFPLNQSISVSGNTTSILKHSLYQKSFRVCGTRDTHPGQFLKSAMPEKKISCCG